MAAGATPLVNIDDPTGDVAAAPSYADIRAVRIDAAGADVRVTVELAGTPPGTLPTAEVMGIGLDVYVGTSSESDYQLFADGEPDGWYAYLQTSKGFVPYPGTFNIEGHTLVFVVPWSSLGDVRQGRVSAFADWSRSGSTTSASTTDHAPESGTATLTR